MKWKLFNNSNRGSLYKLPRKVGYMAVGSGSQRYDFYYLSALSSRVDKQSLGGVDVVFEPESERIVSVILKGPAGSADRSNQALLDAVQGYFMRDGEIDSDEQNFLNLIDHEVVRAHAFE